MSIRGCIVHWYVLSYWLFTWICFREKLAYITTVKMQVPVIPTDSSGTGNDESGIPNATMDTNNTQSEETRMAELLKDDDREGHEV